MNIFILVGNKDWVLDFFGYIFISRLIFFFSSDFPSFVAIHSFLPDTFIILLELLNRFDRMV